ncbi:serine/threonine-protein kinase [Streptomyces sp. MAR4 CNX-425]|uniref:serine/threonine-protein kinase n=1 Tax=Streptomyces sp. MAR4 CNX-425 TaxID=3406343 RepID=UPI003B510767
MRPVGSKYLLEEPLGRGATGTVWRGRQRETAGAEAAVAGSPGEVVAIKVLKEELAGDADVVMRFLRERSALLRLTHPNIVRTRDLVVEGDLLALVMDLVDGPDLHRYLRENGPFSPVGAALLTAQIADALAASHADGIVHRDLKPANVLLAGGTEPDGTGRMHPMLTDFGIARLADSPGLTRTHEFVGTPAYVAPESAEGRPQTSAVDVYGAGILLYELLTGRPPFGGNSALEVLHQHLSQEAQRPPGMPDPMWTVVQSCLRKNPDERPSAESLARGLRTVAAGIGAGATPEQATAALGVAALLAADPHPAQVPGSGAGAADPTQILPGGSGGAPGQPGSYDPNAATSVLPAGGAGAAGAAGAAAAHGQSGPGGPGGAPGSEDGTRVMPVTEGPPQPEGPHPWETQMRAARDRGEQTQQIGYVDPSEDPLRRRPPRRVQRRQPPPEAYAAPPARREPPPQRYEPQPQRYEPRPQPPAPPPQQPPRERRRSANPMRIPGLGCLKGCLFTVLILVVGSWLIWELTPVQDWIADGKGFWDQLSDWATDLKDWIADFNDAADDAEKTKDTIDEGVNDLQDAQKGLDDLKDATQAPGQ